MKRLAIILMLGCILLSGCSALKQGFSSFSDLIKGGTPSVVDADPLARFSEDEIKAGIQKAVNLYTRAYNENNIELLTRAVDQENPPFRRMMQMQFSDYQKSIYGGSGFLSLLVESVHPRENGFVQAKLSQDGEVFFDWVFRMNGKNWVISEPNREQLGKPERVEKNSFVYEMYSWTAETNPEVMALMENAAQRVKDKLGKIPDQKVLVKILPGYSADPYSAPNAMAYYQLRQNEEDMDSIVMYSPGCYNFGWYAGSSTWQNALEDTLVHEFTHLTHRRTFNNSGALMDWFTEGLAEYVSDSARIFEVSEALLQDKLIPIIDTETPVYKQDLMHLYLLEKDKSLAYAEAESLMFFIASEYGGKDAIWMLAGTYDEIQDFDASLQQAFGDNYETFTDKWIAWLKTAFLQDGSGG